MLAEGQGGKGASEGRRRKEGKKMILNELLKRLFTKPTTNRFPAKYLPRSITGFLNKVKSGKTEINPPVALPTQYRGKITYDVEKCTGCRICLRVCPSSAIEFKPEEKKVKIYVAKCTFCSQCVDACPRNCLQMSGEEFMLGNYEKFSQSLVVE